MEFCVSHPGAGATPASQQPAPLTSCGIPLGTSVASPGSRETAGSTGAAALAARIIPLAT